MKAGVYIKNPDLKGNPRIDALLSPLQGKGWEFYDLSDREDLQEGTDMLLSIGGDGTFLSASKRVADRSVPILGVNLGRLGFLSENTPEAVLDALINGTYSLEDRAMLDVRISGSGEGGSIWPYALNEVSVHRLGASVMAVDVSIDGQSLPTYWADGLLVATSSGSTAYSLSVGGPICMPGAKILIISPIAPHNLNVRPLIVPDNAVIGIKFKTRDRRAVVSVDNRNVEVGLDCSLEVSLAQFSLKRVRLSGSEFVTALTSKLHWGEDVRNNL